MGNNKNPPGYLATRRLIRSLGGALEEAESDEVVSIALLTLIGNWIAVEEDPALRKRMAWAIAKSVEVAAELGTDGDWMSETALRHPPCEPGDTDREQHPDHRSRNRGGRGHAA